jgi:hypothetical protein
MWGSIPAFIAKRGEPQKPHVRIASVPDKDSIPVATLRERSREQTENKFIIRATYTSVCVCVCEGGFRYRDPYCMMTNRLVQIVSTSGISLIEAVIIKQDYAVSLTLTSLQNAHIYLSYRFSTRYIVIRGYVKPRQEERT